MRFTICSKTVAEFVTATVKKPAEVTTLCPEPHGARHWYSGGFVRRCRDCLVAHSSRILVRGSKGLCLFSTYSSRCGSREEKFDESGSPSFGEPFLLNCHWRQLAFGRQSRTKADQVSFQPCFISVVSKEWTCAEEHCPRVVRGVDLHYDITMLPKIITDRKFIWRVNFRFLGFEN